VRGERDRLRALHFLQPLSTSSSSSSTEEKPKGEGGKKPKASPILAGEKRGRRNMATDERWRMKEGSFLG